MSFVFPQHFTSLLSIILIFPFTNAIFNAPFLFHLSIVLSCSISSSISSDMNTFFLLSLSLSSFSLSDFTAGFIVSQHLMICLWMIAFQVTACNGHFPFYAYKVLFCFTVRSGVRSLDLSGEAFLI